MYKGPLTHSLHCSEFVELTLIRRLLEAKRASFEMEVVKFYYKMKGKGGFSQLPLS